MMINGKTKSNGDFCNWCCDLTHLQPSKKAMRRKLRAKEKREWKGELNV